MSSSAVIPDGDVIRYRRSDRRKDLRHGKRDGRRGFPALTDVAVFDQPLTIKRLVSPHSEGLRHAALSAMDKQLKDYIHRTEPLHASHAQLVEKIEAGEKAVQRFQEDFRQALQPVTSEELSPRNPLEIDRDQVVLKSRRGVMRERRIARAKAQLQRSISDLDTLRRSLAKTCHSIDHEWALTQVRTHRIRDHYCLRIATYWEGVALAHPDGKHVSNAVSPITIDAPDWAMWSREVFEARTGYSGSVNSQRAGGDR